MKRLRVINHDSRHRRRRTVAIGVPMFVVGGICSYALDHESTPESRPAVARATDTSPCEEQSTTPVTDVMSHVFSVQSVEHQYAGTANDELFF